MTYDIEHSNDGNAFSIMNYVRRCMKKEKCTPDEIETYLKEATSSDYDNLLLRSIEMIEQLNTKAK